MNTCYKTSNNKYQDCPPRMDDARHFTDYRPVCDINNSIKSDNEIENSQNYRLFLQENASQLIESNRKFACMMNCCGPCEKVEEFESTMLPEKIIQKCNERTCTFNEINSRGIGLGRQHYDSDVNTNFSYLKDNSSKNNDCMLLSDKFNHFGDNNHNIQRVTLPRGNNLKENSKHPHNINK